MFATGDIKVDKNGVFSQPVFWRKLSHLGRVNRNFYIDYRIRTFPFLKMPGFLAWLLTVFGFTWKKTFFFFFCTSFAPTLTPIYPLKMREQHSLFINIGDDIYNSEIQITHFHSNTETMNNCNPVIICQEK